MTNRVIEELRFSKIGQNIVAMAFDPQLMELKRKSKSLIYEVVKNFVTADFS